MIRRLSHALTAPVIVFGLVPGVLVFLACAAVVALVLTACTSSDEPAAPHPTGATATTGAPPAAVDLAHLKALAQETMAAYPDPFANPGPYSARAADSVAFIALNATDDPAYLPHLDAVRGANGGFDIFMTVDPSADRPGAGEIDGHFGTKREEFELLGVGLGDRPGDLFVLGDARRPFYVAKERADDPDEDLVYIQGFETEGSIIRLHGSPDDYVLVDADNPNGQMEPTETGNADITEGTAIFYVGDGTDDLIGHVDAVPADHFDLSDPTQFEYATPPSPDPVLEGDDAVAELGGAGTESYPYVASDEAGSVYQVFVHASPELPGGFDGDPSTPGGSFYVAKWDAAGEWQWLALHGTPAEGLSAGQFPWFIGATTEFVFVAGSNRGPYGGPEPAHTDDSSSHGFLAKLDAETEEFLQATQFIPEGHNGNTWTFALDPVGRYVYAAGGTSDNADLPGVVTAPNGQTLPDTSPYVVKVPFDDTTEVKWMTRITDGIAPGFSTDPTFAVLGPEQPDGSRVDLRLSQLTQEVLGGALFVPTEGGAAGEGTIYVTGYASNGGFCDAPRGPTRVWLGALSSTGEFLRCTSFGAPADHQYPFALARDDKGFLYIAGQTAGPIDGEPYHGQGGGFVRKVDPRDDSAVWTRLIGTDDADDIHGLDIVGKTIFLSGTTWGAFEGQNNAGAADLFAATLTLDGELTGVDQTGTPGIAWALGVVGRPDGTALVSGMTEGSLAGPHQGGVTDVVLVRLDPS